MNVHGYAVTAEQEAAVIAAMRRGPFRASDLAQAAADAGVPRSMVGTLAFTCERVADRMIQREKKAGRIVLHGREWRSVAA